MLGRKKKQGYRLEELEGIAELYHNKRLLLYAVIDESSNRIVYYSTVRELAEDRLNEVQKK